MVLIMNIDKDFQNIVSKVLQMAQKVAQKWHKCPKIEIALNYLEICTETISNMLITNMNRAFENVITYMLQMAHKVVQKVEQMSKS